MARDPRLPCPSCGYDLVGIIREDNTARCPECGREATLEAIGAELRKRAAWWHGPLAFLIAFAALVLISNVSGLSLSEFGLSNLLFAGLMAFIALIASYWWIDLTRIERMAFAAGALAFASLDSLWMQPVLLSGWYACFWVYSFLREWRRIGDRY